MNTEIQNQLKELALKRSKPFCYSCYEEAPTGQCKDCGSDDLMRLAPEVGCEYGADWIIEHILNTELDPIDMDTAFEDHVRGCYSETTTVGWMELDTVSIMKEMDPVSWRCAQDDWESQETAEDIMISFDNGSTYYWVHEVEALLQRDRALL